MGLKRKEDKTMKKNILSLAALLIASATFVACSSDDSVIEEQPVQPTEQVYTMTVNASKGGDATTRALALDGKKLNATWTAGDEVSVYNETKKADITGTLVAQSTGESTTLTGTLTGTIEDNDELTLKFLSPTYATQDGTLTGSATSIDKVCDYATATVTATVTDGNVTASDADFQNQQAIVKFMLKKKADDSDLNIPANTAFTVSNGTNSYTVTPTTATNVLFVALPATVNVNLSTNIDGITYNYNKTGAGLEAGKYYEISVKMARATIDLSKLTKNTTLLNGDVVTNKLDEELSPVQISIADGATVTLSDATINGVDKGSYRWAGITCEGDAIIILSGRNTVKGFHNNYPGIYVPSGKTLTIQGSGSLDASSNGQGAGIGGGENTTEYNIDCGDIVIKGGTITATGGNKAAGIGSGSNAKCGNITIEGGTITATGGANAAGIGGGYDATCGTITITNSVTKVEATKGENAPNSIGAGYGGTCGTVTIGSTVYDNGITASPYTYPEP